LSASDIPNAFAKSNMQYYILCFLGNSKT
jgi:hypothetical protein